MAEQTKQRSDAWVSDGIAEEPCTTTLGTRIVVYYVRVGGETSGEFRNKGDALLFQAAPDMHAVCRAVSALADGRGRANLLEVAGQARAALAKADA